LARLARNWRAVSEDTRAVAADDLPARLIKPHTLEKFDYHDRYCEIVAVGMPGKWDGNVGYLELMAGSGIAMSAATGEEIEASPLRAAGQLGFRRLAYVEADEDLASALARRLRARGHSTDRARVFRGDANDPEVLERALAFLGRGLLVTFIDPEDINHWWTTNAFLASRRRSIDFLINLPIGPMKRELGNGRFDSTVRVIGTDEWIPRYKAGEHAGTLLRSTYADQFKTLGFPDPKHEQIRSTDNQAPLYDLVFASRHPRAHDFWDRITARNVYGQARLPLGGDR
jgi:three-Cys-motif partner protein